MNSTSTRKPFDFKALLAKVEKKNGEQVEPNTFTLAEFREDQGLSEKAAATKVRELYDAGAVEHAMIRRPTAWGFWRTTCGYRVTEGGKKCQ